MVNYPLVDGLFAAVCPDHSTQPIRIFTGHDSERSNILSEGVYLLTHQFGCYFLQGDSNVTANSDSCYLEGGKYLTVAVPSSASRRYIAATSGFKIENENIIYFA